jgi:trk system potassium uptake protein TrkA
MYVRVLTVQVVIVGAGEVGTSVAADLAGDHDVVLIDINEARVEDIRYDIDVLTLAGDGTSADVLEEAGVPGADLVIASTDDDTTNLVTCGTAKVLGDPFTIARVKDADYQDTWERTEDAYGVDFMVCSNLQAAETIVNVIGLPSATDVSSFVGGLVQMAVFKITDGSPIAGQTVAGADQFDLTTFAALFRNGDIVLPRGSTTIGVGDRVVVIGGPESIHRFAQSTAPAATPGEADDIVFVGGSEIGYNAADLLEERGFSPKLIEEEADRARTLAEALPDTLVMNHDPTDTEFLRRERVHEADILVSTLDSDEGNMLVSVLAKQLEVGRVISLVDQPEYVQLFEQLGIDVAVSPRNATAEEIVRFTHEKVALNITVLENDQAEVIELKLNEDSELVGRTIQAIDEDIGADVVFAAVCRAGDLVIPRGDTVLEAGDNVVIFVEAGFVTEMLEMG